MKLQQLEEILLLKCVDFFVFADLFYRKVVTVFNYTNLEFGYFKRYLIIFEFRKRICLNFEGVHPFIPNFTFEKFSKFKIFPSEDFKRDVILIYLSTELKMS